MGVNTPPHIRRHTRRARRVPGGAGDVGEPTSAVSLLAAQRKRAPVAPRDNLIVMTAAGQTLGRPKETYLGGTAAGARCASSLTETRGPDIKTSLARRKDGRHDFTRRACMTHSWQRSSRLHGRGLP